MTPTLVIRTSHAEDLAVRVAIVDAIADRTSRAFQVQFQPLPEGEATHVLAAPQSGIGPATIAKWSRIARVAEKILLERRAYSASVQEITGAAPQWHVGGRINK